MSDILDGKLPVNTEVNNGGYDYFGFVHKNGSWTIMKSTTSTAAQIRYAVGSSDYATGWANRASLTYTYLSVG